MNELITNSLKHAFPEGREGEIQIELSESKNDYAFLVSDNGIGFQKDLNFRDTETLGLQLVNTLVDQLNGTIELDRSTGTVFKLEFKKPKFEGAA